jgi:tripartite-type tricarboxylate transporter receptor subunit TctC
MKRKQFLSLTAAALGSMLAPVRALAQAAYPANPIKWIVPFPAGGGTDVVARLLSQSMARGLGTTFVVENRPGAGTMIAADVIARSAQDGYTIGTVDVSTVALAPHLYSNVKYDPLKDFTYVGGANIFPFVLVVRPEMKINSLTELLAMAKSSKNPLTYATPGAGGPNHLGMELFQRKAGIKLTHVPYRGDAPAIQDLLGGQVDMYLVNTAASLPYIRSGKLVPLAVAMSKRIDVLPQLPTFAEQGVPNFESYAWQGVAAPAGTPPAVIARLQRELKAALESEEIKTRFLEMGLQAFPVSSEAFAKHVAEQSAQWGELIRSAGIKLEN